MSQKECIVLLGPPNSGKTTLFNWLTGYKSHAVNYPGSTVDYLKGIFLKKYQIPCQLIDTPGVYSLKAKNPSEAITLNILNTFPVQKICITLDMLRVHRQLPFILQLKETGIPIVVALTMANFVSKDQWPDVDKLSQELGLDIVIVDGKLGYGILELVEVLKKETPKDDFKRPLDHSKFTPDEKLFQRTDRVMDQFFSQIASLNSTTNTLDKVLLHPFVGLIGFFAIMAGLFSSIFWLAAPLMDIVDVSFSFLSHKVSLLGDNLAIDFLSNGLITSFAAVFIFVPQIFILFAGICALEDSGYLARSASLADAFFSKIGLSGRSFVPFLSGYACAIPATLAARNISSRTERMIVTAVIPLLTCSARLPVYALLLSLFFYGAPAWKPGLAMAAIYILSMSLACLASFIISRFVPNTGQTPFVMELPIYKIPTVLNVLSSAWRRTKHYVKEAGPLIFIFTCVIWVSTHFPRDVQLSEQDQLEQSYAGQAGRAIEPIFEWMGGDWRVGVSLMTAFVAREVFISTLAVLFSISGDQSDETIQGSLLKKMRQAENKRGDPLFTPLTLFLLILFFMISLQCLSTTAIVKKETGSTLFAVGQLLFLNASAYFLCVAIYQIFQ